jgi:adenine-specific DNA methylase
VEDRVQSGQAEAVALKPARRAIEEYFPIVEINRLAIPERNAFKPIYQMHKWFARRASCVFRAILLGALKPAGTDIMQEFYRDHSNDPDTKGKVILDPFMGGGTTVVEALRLGCHAIGIDLNPVAWFIVKTEVEPVDLKELEAAFERLANRKTASGKSVREELLSHYKTKCPACGNEDADIIYVFWVKSAICTNPDCKKQVPLFSDYLVAQKTPSIRFYEATCPHDDCRKSFDWEIEPAALVGEQRLMLASAFDGAGEGRGNKRWAFSEPSQPTACPWCERNIVPRPRTAKPQRKKVKLSVLYCPNCATVFQYRGTPPEDVACPGCSQTFKWKEGNTRDKGRFKCPHCGQNDAVIESIRRLPDGQLLPTRMYALEGYCPACGGDDEEEEEENNQHTLEAAVQQKARQATTNADRTSILWKNNGKFFKAVSPADERRYQEACQRWEREKDSLPYPKQEIPDGQETHRLLEHHYRYWHQMFNPRQLLCLSGLLRAIGQEADQRLKELLLSAFFNVLNNMSDFTTYIWQRDCTRQVFARHDFAPKDTSCESSVWGAGTGMGNFHGYFGAVLRGVEFACDTSDRRFDGSFDKNGKAVLEEFPSGDKIYNPRASWIVHAGDSRQCPALLSGLVPDVVVTDPPYASNVNYSELADFFYVWLRLLLAEEYAPFAPDHTPKVDEVVVNLARGLALDDFKGRLAEVFGACARVLPDRGLMAFTFHHEEGETWAALLEALFEAGWEVNAVYPVQGEPVASLNLLTGSNIAYDLIHVCRKRDPNATRQRIAWATVRNEVRRTAREEILRIEAGTYGERGQLSDADRFIVLIGKCLQLYSRHYGAVVDHHFQPVPLRAALADIRMLLEQLVSRERPLPSELEDIDRPSYIWLTTLSAKKEIKSDEVHKATRGIIEVDELIEAGLIKRGRVGRGGRTFEVKTPGERFSSLMEKFRNEPPPQPTMFPGAVQANSDSLFIDRLHFLISLAEGKEDLRPWLERWKAEIPQFRAAAEYLLKQRARDLEQPLRKILGMVEVGPLGFE